MKLKRGLPDPRSVPTNLDELSTHAQPIRRQVLISLRLISGHNPVPQGSGFTGQDPDGNPDTEFNFSEIKSRSLMENPSSRSPLVLG